MTTTVRIAGMTSVHAARALFTALAGVEGIARADVKVGEAIVEHDGRATPEALREVVESLGYTVVELREERRGLPVL
jgi:copper chaperone CopZ